MNQGTISTDSYGIHHCDEYTRFTASYSPLANEMPVHKVILDQRNKRVHCVREILGHCFSLITNVIDHKMVCLQYSFLNIQHFESQ